jgi:hypothetical protein
VAAAEAKAVEEVVANARGKAIIKEEQEEKEEGKEDQNQVHLYLSYVMLHKFLCDIGVD